MLKPRPLTLIAFFSLSVWLVLWFSWLSPAHTAPIVGLVIALVPLAAVAGPLLANKTAAHAWCSFIALGYMAHALTEIFAHADDRYLAMVELALVGVLFIAGGAAYRAARAMARHPMRDDNTS